MFYFYVHASCYLYFLQTFAVTSRGKSRWVAGAKIHSNAGDKFARRDTVESGLCLTGLSRWRFLSFHRVEWDFHPPGGGMFMPTLYLSAGLEGTLAKRPTSVLYFIGPFKFSDYYILQKKVIYSNLKIILTKQWRS